MYFPGQQDNPPQRSRATASAVSVEMSEIVNSASLITDSTAIPSNTTKDDTRPMSKSKMITAAEKAALEGKNEEWDTQMCTELQNEFLSVSCLQLVLVWSAIADK